MGATRISILNPRVWGVIIDFKVLKKGVPREVKFKDGSPHKVAEHKVGDESGTILLTVWDDKIEYFKEGSSYEIDEANLSVFDNSLKLNMSKKSKITDLDRDIKVDESNDMSSKFVEVPKYGFKRGYKKRDSLQDDY